MPRGAPYGEGPSCKHEAEGPLALFGGIEADSYEPGITRIREMYI
jgi:hypothetical protein